LQSLQKYQSKEHSLEQQLQSTNAELEVKLAYQQKEQEKNY